MAVNQDGFREVIGSAEGMKEDRDSWLNFLKSLKARGLDGTQLFVGDRCLGLLEAVHEVFPAAKFQRCTVHFYRKVFSVTPRSKVKLVAAMLKAIHAQEDKTSALEKAKSVAEKLREMNRGDLKAITLPMLFHVAEGEAGLEKALAGLCDSAAQAVRDGYSILILSDRGVDRDHAPIPSLLATSAVHHHLIRQGTRTQCGLVVETGEAREAHRLMQASEHFGKIVLRT
jgi:hypothetical protein